MRKLFMGIAILSAIACVMGYFIQNRQEQERARTEGIRGVITQQTCPVCGATMTGKAEIVTKIYVADSIKVAER
jgi:hypothetical protein